MKAFTSTNKQRTKTGFIPFFKISVQMHAHQGRCVKVFFIGIFFVKLLIRIIILTFTIVLRDVKFARKPIWKSSENKLQSVLIYKKCWEISTSETLCRKCISTGARRSRSFGHHLLHPQILRPDCTLRSIFLTHALQYVLVSYSFKKTQNFPLYFLKLLKFSIFLYCFCIFFFLHYHSTSTINFLYQKLIQLRVFSIFKASDPLNHSLSLYI